MITIDKFVSDDAWSLYEIENACFSSCWSYEQFKCIGDLDYARFFVAKCDGTAVGFAGIYLLGDAELVNIAVLPEHRKKGIAQSLLETCVELAKKENCFKMFLEVRKSNTAAISLYSKNGFTDVAIRKKYYSDPTEDAVVMVKEIK